MSHDEIEKRRASRRAYYWAHRQERCAHMKEYRNTHKEEMKKRKHIEYMEHRDEVLERVCIYRAKNHDEIAAKVLSRQRTLRGRIMHNIRTRVHVALKDYEQAAPTMELLGCSVDELKLWIEMRFAQGMSWDNYNIRIWHIDHIKPCSFFDLSDHNQQKKCFHYTNLQPLWANENLRKKRRELKAVAS